MAKVKQRIADEQLDAATLTHRDVRKLLIDCGFANMTHLTIEVQSGLFEKQPINLSALVAFDEEYIFISPVATSSTSSSPLSPSSPPPLIPQDCSICFD